MKGEVNGWKAFCAKPEPPSTPEHIELTAAISARLTCLHWRKKIEN